MNESEALNIIRALADGVNPCTGEVFPKDSPYQNAQTVRALHSAVSALEAAAKRKKRKKKLPERAGQPWKNEEDNMLIKKFDDGAIVSEIAKEHQRTTGAIKSRLEKLGELPKTISEGQPGRATN